MVITDIVESRLKLAKELGAWEAIDVKGLKPAEVAQKIREAFGGVMPEAAIECSGAPPSIETAILVITLYTYQKTPTPFV